jgi:hypothetical protein
MRALKVTLSGSYRDGRKDVHDYVVDGVVPYNDSDVVEMHLQNRFAVKWIKESGKYPNSVRQLRTTYVDDMEEIDAEFSFMGKDIRSMSFDELQDLSVAKDLRSVPAEKGDLREARTRAYAEYAEKVLGRSVQWRKDGFNLMSEPEIVVGDAAPIRQAVKRVNQDDVNQMAFEGVNVESEAVISFDALSKMADLKDIKHDGRTSYDSLYRKVFPDNQ